MKMQYNVRNTISGKDRSSKTSIDQGRSDIHNDIGRAGDVTRNINKVGDFFTPFTVDDLFLQPLADPFGEIFRKSGWAGGPFKEKNRPVTRFSHSTGNFPLYNVVQEKDGYLLELAVAGFAKEDLEVVNHYEKIAITGKVNRNGDPVDEREFLHKGISEKQFAVEFHIDGIIKEVQSPQLSNGILSIKIVMQSPEPQPAKGRVLPIVD